MTAVGPNDSSNPAAGMHNVAIIALGLMLMGALMPAPLFELYHRTWNLSPFAISFIFAVYAASLIPSLLLLGGTSDIIGRRRTILLTFALLAVAALLFAVATNVWWIVAARIVQGLAMGMGIGAASAAIHEWSPEAERSRSGMYTVVAIGIGSTAGALVGATLAQYAPDPFGLTYFVYIAFLAVIGVLVARVPKCPHVVTTKHQLLIRIPASVQRPFLLASLQAFVGWSTFGVFMGLVPAYLVRALELRNLIVGGCVVAGIQLGAAGASIAAAHLKTRQAIIVAMFALAVGLWLLQIGIAIHAYPLIALSVLIAGAGGGTSYLAGLNIINAIAPPEHSAEMLSAFAVACYLGFSVPVLSIGIAAVHFGLAECFIALGIVLAALSILVVAFATEGNLRPQEQGS